jgi:hypothetical protein
MKRLLFAFCLVALVTAPAVARTVIPDAAQPQLAVASDGRVWLVYGQVEAAPAQSMDHTQHNQGSHGADAAKSRPGGGIFVACSEDGGSTFAPAIKVGTVPGLMLGMRRGPRIAVNGNRLTVTAIGDELFALASSDGGKTWSEPTTVNDAPKSAAEGLHDLACAPDGRLFATWLDIRNGKMELWGAESSDGGKSWAKNEQVYKSPDKSICECCHPSALFDSDGNLAVMWRNSIEGSRDLWMTTRLKGATKFAAAHKLGEGTWKLNACPMDGGRIVALGGGKFGAVWQRAGEVFFTGASGPEIQLGKGKQPVAVANGASPLVLWQEGSDLVLTRALGAAPSKLASDARFPVVVTLGQRGNLVAYEQGPAKEKQPGVVIERL